MSNEYKEFYDEIYSQDTETKDLTSGWIQWKGTNVCIDIDCICGHSTHIDGDFFYYYECKGCGRVFAVGQNIKLIELNEKQTLVARERDSCYYTSDEVDE